MRGSGSTLGEMGHRRGSGLGWEWWGSLYSDSVWVLGL